MRRIKKILVFALAAATTSCVVLWEISLRQGIDIEISVAPKIYRLGEPVELTIDVHNQFIAHLVAGAWITQSEYSCEELSWASYGISFSVYSSERGALFFRTRLPEPEEYIALRIAPGERFNVTCNLTEVFNLSKPGRYRAEAQISGKAFRFDDDSWRRIYRRSVTAALERLSEHVVAEFEVRRLSAEELVEVRDRARTGEIAAIRILGAHRDAAGVEALDQVWAIPALGIRQEAARALAEIPGKHATDALGHGLELEKDPRLKEEMASLLVEGDRAEAEPWIRKMAEDTLVYHDIYIDGHKHKFYRLRHKAKLYFERRNIPIDVVVAEPWNDDG